MCIHVCCTWGGERENFNACHFSALTEDTLWCLHMTWGAYKHVSLSACV